MILRSCIVLPLTILLIVGCQPETAAEKKVIGVWEFTGLDAVVRIVFRRDHKVVELFRDPNCTIDCRWDPTFAGRWQVEAGEIVTHEAMLPYGDTLPPPRVTRIQIRELQADRLLLNGHPDLVKATIDVERHLQMMALLYSLLAGGLFLLTFLSARRSAFRRDLILLAVGFGGALAWSALTLLVELTQTGNVILSPVALRSLRSPMEPLRVLCLLLLAFAFAKLMFALRSAKWEKQAAGAGGFAGSRLKGVLPKVTR